jgi:hypothetical protein
MADLTPYPDTADDPGPGPDRRSTGGMPPWVKVSLIIVAVLVALFVVLNLTGLGGDHGPGRHVGPAGGAQTPSSSVTEHRPPPGNPDHGR